MKIIFACGGTGGHIYPAVAMYHEFKKHDTNMSNRYLFVGSDRGLEGDIYQAESIPDYQLIKSRGIERSFSLQNFNSIWCNLVAFSQAKKIVRNFKPDLIISTGSYPCFHITFYASKYKIPFFFIEGNALPGIVVKLFQKTAKRIFASTDLIRKYLKTDSNIRISGLPTRDTRINKSKTEILNDLGFIEDKSLKNKFSDHNVVAPVGSYRAKMITIIGGSCGSPELNVAVSGLIDDNSLNYQILWATGKREYEKVMDRTNDIPGNVKIVDYINNMPEILSVTDMLISRSGAMTIQEIKDFKLPAILVPFARAAENHQYINASELAELGVAEIIEEKDIDSNILSRTINAVLLNENNIKEIYKNNPALNNENVSEKIYEEIIDCVKETI